jgi:hypothetical protein
VPAPPGKPRRAGVAISQQFAERVAQSPEVWTRASAHEVIRRYAELAPRWDAERGYYRAWPIRDALARGGPWQRGSCVEIGAGTGLITASLSTVWNPVVGVDLSADMVRRNPHAPLVLADAARLPVRNDSAAAVVVGDGPLFAREVVRVLERSGALVWCNALGSGAPNYVRTEVLAAALCAASEGDSWDAVEAEAGWGTWAVLRRTSTTAPPP